jgi:hypothetical protein
MKIFIVIGSIAIIVFIVFQIYSTMATGKTETQQYKVIRREDKFEIRYYPSVVLAKISSTSNSYLDLGYSGFGKLAKYIFGGNSENKKIAMTSPVHMDIGDTVSTMAFVMPSSLKKEDMPIPDNSEILIQTSESEYVASFQFGGFANNYNINKNKAILEKLLHEKGISYYGNFRFLGYNPPYHIFDRRNEVIVAINPDEINDVQPKLNCLQ